MSLKYNAIRCDACHTVIESKHRHDFRSCPCDRVSVDGGHAYQRCLWTDDGGPYFTTMTKESDDGPWVPLSELGESDENHEFSNASAP